MVINLSNSVDLPKGTVFTLTDSEYVGNSDKNSWEHIDGGVSGITLKYEGQNPISSGSSICIVIPYVANGSPQTLPAVRVNGMESQFSSSSSGRQNPQGVTPNIKLNRSGFDHLYLMQSEWVVSQDEFLAPGPVIDGFVSVPSGTNKGTVSTPYAIGDRDIIHYTPSLFYAFVICDDLLYFCNIVELLNGSSNWTISSGSSANDLHTQGICSAVCNFSDCDGGVEFQEIALGEVCTYSICNGSFSNFGALVIEDIIVDGISLSEEAGFSFPYCWVNESDQGVWYCGYGDAYGCPSNLLCVDDELINDLAAWLTANDYVYDEIFTEFRRGFWCITITLTDAKFETAFFGYEAFDLEIEEIIYAPDGTTEEYVYDTLFIGEFAFNTYIGSENCIGDLWKVVAIPHGCPDPEYLWGDNSENPYIVTDNASYYLTITCGNNCTYESGGVIEEIIGIGGGGSLQESEDELTERSSGYLQSSDLAIRVFPNPAVDKVVIEVQSLHPGDHELTITGVNGATIHSETITNSNGLLTRSIDLRSYAAGLYLVKVQVDGNVVAEKFAVIK